VTAAKGGTLTFMVGGKEEAYEKAAKILQHMGKNVIHTGATGTGQVISNQSIVTVLQINLGILTITNCLFIIINI